MGGLVSMIVSGGTQSDSTIGVPFGRGLGVTSEKSAALLSVSSPGSSRCEQPAAMERSWIALPGVTPLDDAGSPALSGRSALPVKAPQDTQSTGEASSKKMAPAAADRARFFWKSRPPGELPSPITIVALLSPSSTLSSMRKVWCDVPDAFQTEIWWLSTRFPPPATICNST